MGALGWAITTEMAPPQAAGFAMNGLANIAGIVTPIVTGYLVQRTVRSAPPYGSSPPTVCSPLPLWLSWGRSSGCSSTEEAAWSRNPGLSLHSVALFVQYRLIEATECSDRPGCGVQSARRVQRGGRALRPGHGRGAGSASRGAARRTGLPLHSSGGILGNQSLGAGKCSDRPGGGVEPARRGCSVR